MLPFPATAAVVWSCHGQCSAVAVLCGTLQQQLIAHDMHMTTLMVMDCESVGIHGYVCTKLLYKTLCNTKGHAIIHLQLPSCLPLHVLFVVHTLHGLMGCAHRHPHQLPLAGLEDELRSPHTHIPPLLLSLWPRPLLHPILQSLGCLPLQLALPAHKPRWYWLVHPVD